MLTCYARIVKKIFVLILKMMSNLYFFLEITSCLGVKAIFPFFFFFFFFFFFSIKGNIWLNIVIFVFIVFKFAVLILKINLRWGQSFKEK